MRTQRWACVVGARPNFMKVAPLLREASRFPDIDVCLIHTGQHYDRDLSDVFFEELGIRAPDFSLGVGSGSHGEQTARLITELERTFMQAVRDQRPFDRVIVVGDINSTMAAALAAAKLGMPIAHVEAGLRSLDRSMPEEINRLVTDVLADTLLCSEPDGVANLLKEGHPQDRVFLVGNVMIDTLMYQLGRISTAEVLDKYSYRRGDYGVVTLHRPSNVDRSETLAELVDVLCDISRRIPMLFAVHPRTKDRLTSFGLLPRLESHSRMRVTAPLGYNEFLALTSNARVIVTDSGGLQEESTALRIPCLTMRENTERPITVTHGSSTLCGNSAELLRRNLDLVLQGTYKNPEPPELWDGKASERIVAILRELGGRSKQA